MSTEPAAAQTAPRLTALERRVLLSVPGLFPDGDSDDLKFDVTTPGQISYALQHLIDLKLVVASQHEGVHQYAHYFRDVELTPLGTELARDFGRPWIVRFWSRDWKWLLNTAIAVVALILSIWNLLHNHP